MAQSTPSEIIVVLGCLTNPDGTTTKMMEARVQKAAELYMALKQQNVESRVIVTGYQATGQVVTEASAMEKYAVNNNLIDAEHIIKEEKASSTVENAYFSRVIIDQYEVNNVHIVTSDFHVEHAKRYFEQLHPQAYNLQFYGCTHAIDDTEKEYRESREKRLHSHADYDIQIVVKKVMPDCRPIEVLQSKLIPTDTFNHGFTTRHGGVSTYRTLASLNLVYSVKRRDPLINVQENRHRLAVSCHFDVEQFHVAKCAHGANVWVVDDREPDRYDAIVTGNSHVTVAAPGADCPTVLFCDPVRKICGAAHSGWRGTLDMICVVVVNVMVSRFKCKLKDIHVAIGPSIGPCCFEVGEDVSEKFAQTFGESVVVRKPGKPRPFVDLQQSIRLQLIMTGIQAKNIDDETRTMDRSDVLQQSTQCTKCDSQGRFFSYRRDGTQFGTQVAFINIKL